MRAYVDADVLIWHLRGDEKALRFLKRLRASKGYELWTGVMQRAEVVFFMRSGEERATLLFLSQFKTAPIDQRIVDAAAELYRQWQPSHGLDINDAILAATVMQSGGQIFCLNTKHYPIPDLLVKKAW
jgi:predicted nucleic acid-binding protein